MYNNNLVGDNMFRVHYKMISGKDVGLSFFGNTRIEPTVGEIRRGPDGNYQVVSYVKL